MAFQPDNALVTLPGPMPAAYRTPPTGMPLFLRLWQEDLPFRLGNQVELTGTGLAVLQTVISASQLDIDRFTTGSIGGFTISPAKPGQVVIAWLTGLGGVGKSRLVQEFTNLRYSQAEGEQARTHHDGLVALAVGNGGR